MRSSDSPRNHMRPQARKGGEDVLLSPLPLPAYRLIAQWAEEAAHQDPITKRVLARLGAQLLKSAWESKRTREGVLLAYAAIGDPTHLSESEVPKWWPVPPNVWRAAQVGLIGDSNALRALLEVLRGR